MDTKRLFMKMKDTSQDGYRLKQSLYLIGKSAVRYAVFPLVICAVLAGGGFTAADSVTVDGGNAVFESFKKSSILVGSPEDFAVEACGEITDDSAVETEKETDDGTYGGTEDEAEENNEELLQRLYDFDKSKVPDGYIGIVPVSLYRQPKEGCVYVSDAGNKKQLEAARGKLRVILGTKTRLEQQLDSLDESDPHFARKNLDLQRRYDEQYDLQEEAEEEIKQVQDQIRTIRQEQLTGDNIYRLLLAFDQLYNTCSEAEQRDLMRALIERIDLYPEKPKGGCWIRKIVFNFPIPINGEEVQEFPLENQTMFETVVSLSKLRRLTQNS